ncbi:unnamed protein product [marine sediment metagenome]|uniref:Uncharacterized protein n=1 Tax=marine sediment metagenome TaxID=412755 RepID=X1KPF0_9ZZZZ
MPQVGVASPSQVEDLWTCLLHRSYIFPDDIAKTVTFTAGAGAGDYDDWAEIADNLGAKLSDLTTADLHISGLKIRSESADEKLYQIQLGYGESAEAVTVIDPHELGSGTKHVEGDEQVRFRPPLIPTGSKVYYRMKCETGGATCIITLRYHYH